MNDLIKHIETTIMEYYVNFPKLEDVTSESCNIKGLDIMTLKNELIEVIKRDEPVGNLNIIGLKWVDFITNNLTEDILETLLKFSDVSYNIGDYYITTTEFAPVLDRLLNRYINLCMYNKLNSTIEEIHTKLSTNGVADFSYKCVNDYIDISSNTYLEDVLHSYYQQYGVVLLSEEYFNGRIGEYYHIGLNLTLPIPITVGKVEPQLSTSVKKQTFWQRLFGCDN